jgi:ABC-type branched-subunit amino acid transport system substrate-binding protein
MSAAPKVLRSALLALTVLALVGPACAADRKTSSEAGGSETRGGDDAPAAEASPDFGSLKDVCQDGDGGGATAQGVTASEIQVGTVSDVGFTKNREFVDAAEVFTTWCNANGGINGRKLTFETRDAKLFEYRQRILESCKADFFLVGGGAAFDANGVKDRLKCLLPEIPAQTVSSANNQSGLQAFPMVVNPEIGPYEGYYKWLVTEKYPESADAIGIIAGDVGVVRKLGERETETMKFLGADVIYQDYYPAAGVSDWTPYAQTIKSKGVKGLIFEGDYVQLAKLEQALSTVGADLDWIDTNTNAYNEKFIELTGDALDEYDNYAAPMIVPTEAAADNPATKELVELYEQYAPDAVITGPTIQAFSAWLLFATSARDCGADLTRRCAFENAVAQKAWDGGGLHAAKDLTDPGSKKVCFTVVQAKPDGFEVADFAPTDGLLRCEEHQHQLEGNYGKAVTLEDVGLTIDDLE